MRHKFTAATFAIAILAGFALDIVPSLADAQDASSQPSLDKPASPAQLSAWNQQKAGLQADQQKAQSERAALPAQQQALQADIARMTAILDGQTLTGEAAAASGKAVIQGANPFDKRTAQERAIDNAWVAVQERNAMKDLRDQKKAELARLNQRQVQLDAEIPARADQIAQLDKTIEYYKNPYKGELDNQNERLKNYERQRTSTPDPGLDSDIQDAKRRINELNDLQKQFQGGGGSRGSSSSSSDGQPQPQSYNAPGESSGTNSQLQVPPGFVPGGYIGVPPVYGAPVPPRWTDLPTAPPRQRSGGSPPAGPTGGKTPPSNPGSPPPVAQGPGSTQPPPASGGQCSQPLCYQAGQQDCEKGPLPSDAGWLRACTANMLLRCNQGEAGGTGGWCVHKGADPSCAVRAQRVCGERIQVQ